MLLVVKIFIRDSFFINVYTFNFKNTFAFFKYGICTLSLNVIGFSSFIDFLKSYSKGFQSVY